MLKVLNQNCSLKNSLFCILNLWGGGGGITSLDLSSKNTFFGRLLEYVFLLPIHKLWSYIARSYPKDDLNVPKKFQI